MSDKERLALLIAQGHKVKRGLYGVAVLSMCLIERIERMPGGAVDSGWIAPALGVLDRYTSDLMEWWDDRLTAAEGKP